VLRQIAVFNPLTVIREEGIVSRLFIPLTIYTIFTVNLWKNPLTLYSTIDNNSRVLHVNFDTTSGAMMTHQWSNLL